MAKKYNDDFDDEQRAFSMPVVIMTAVVSGIILVILLIVFATNKTSNKNPMLNPYLKNDLDKTNSTDNAYARTGDEDYEDLYREGKLRAEDLDIWDMYGRDSSSDSSSSDSSEEPSEVSSDDETEDEASPSPSPSATSSPDKEDSESDEDELLDGVKENTINYANLQIIDNKMVYKLNGEKISHLGVMISADNGIVDFATLKANGIDFVMIKVGSRGYSSGVINADDNFLRNVKAASENGLAIGLYFSSRAITVNEAREEAEYCISQTYEYDIKYPIAFVFEGELVDAARTDILERDELTKVADAFLTEVRLQGKNAIVYGDEKFLLKDLDPKNLLREYDVFLNDQSLMPEYKYQFKLWRYSVNQSIPGIERGGDYIISFVDYAGR